VEFTLNDARQDLIGEAIDIAIRVGHLTDSSLVARRIGQVHRVVVASPSYLAKYGTPSSPGELADHAVIFGPAGRGQEGWAFRKEGKATSVRIEGRFVLSATEAATTAAVAGLGLLSTGDLSVLTELENGSLVRVLPEWEMGSADINAILPGGRAAKPSARAFAEFAAAELENIRARQASVWQSSK
jgi:DNA-binding transcriptional LysR family regulator